MSILDTIDNYFSKPNESDFFLLFNNIQFNLSAGIPIKQTLDKLSISGIAKGKPLGKALKRISIHLKNGKSVGESFALEPIFPKIVAPIITAGESAGQLNVAFLKMADVMWLQHNLYSKVKNALLMPKLALVVMLFLIIGFVKLALPEYIKMYQDSKMELSGIITSVNTGVNAIVDYWPITFLVIILVIKGIEALISLNRTTWDAIRLKIPIYKKLHFLFIQHQLVSVLSLMMTSGLTLKDAFNQAVKTVDNSVMARAISYVSTDYAAGFSLDNAFQRRNKSKVFDEALISALNAGATTGQMTNCLEIAEKYYERLLNNSIDPTTTKLTCVVMVPMGIFIVSMYLFMMMPVFDFMGKLKVG